MGFSEFVETISHRLQAVGGRVSAHQHEPGDSSWLISFTRAVFSYRLIFERRNSTIFLQKAQGSFVVGSQMKWTTIDSRQTSGDDFASAAAEVMELLERFPRRDAPQSAAS